MGPDKLGPAVTGLVNSILNLRTRQTYKQAWQSLKQFLPSIGISTCLPLSIDTLLAYIAYLNGKDYAAATIATHVSAFSFVHKINNLPSPSDSFLISRILKKLLINSPSDYRKPISPEILIQIIGSLSHICKSYYETSLFRCMFIIAFLAMLRISEFTSGNRSNHNIMYENVVVNTDNVVLTLLSYKHSAAPVSLVLNAVRNKTMCPVQAMRSYLINRGTNSGYLFVQADGSPISRSHFTKRLNECLKFCGVDTQNITSHSFRIGGATHAARCGHSDDAVKKMGRWKSNALSRYIRLPSLQVGPSPHEMWAPT